MEIPAKVADYKIIISTQKLIEWFNEFNTSGNQQNRTIAGLVFFPLTQPLVIVNQAPFHSWGIRVAIATWEGLNPETLEFYNSTRIIVAPQASQLLDGVDTRLYSGQPIITLNENYVPAPNNPNQWEVIIQNENNVSDYERNLMRTKLARFSNTSEYDLAFLEFEMCKYLAGITSPAGTWSNSIGWTSDYGYGASKFYENQRSLKTRGLQFSRAFFEIDVDERDRGGVSILNLDQSRDLTRWRTLKCNPWPIPAIIDFAGRPSAAYHLTPVCPPGWMPNATNYPMSTMLIHLHNRAIKQKWVPSEPRGIFKYVNDGSKKPMKKSGSDSAKDVK